MRTVFIVALMKRTDPTIANNIGFMTMNFKTDIPLDVESYNTMANRLLDDRRLLDIDGAVVMGAMATSFAAGSVPEDEASMVAQAFVEVAKGTGTIIRKQNREKIDWKMALIELGCPSIGISFVEEHMGAQPAYSTTVH